MKTLAKGTNSDAIFKLIKVLINMQQEDYKMAIQGDTTEINDVCSQLTTERQLYGQNETKDGLNLKGMVEESADEDANPSDQRAQLSPQPFNDMEANMPLNNVILGINQNEAVNQINTGKNAFPEGQKLQDLKQQTGWRSAQFDFLLKDLGQ